MHYSCLAHGSLRSVHYEHAFGYSAQVQLPLFIGKYSFIQ